MILIRVFKNNQLVEVKQFTEPQILIGSGDEALLRLKSDDISGLHALIELRNSGYFVSDLGSKTGIKIKSESVLDRAISSGEVIQIGPFEIHFFVGVPKPISTPSQPIKEEKKIIPQAVIKPNSVVQPVADKPSLKKVSSPSVAKSVGHPKNKKTYSPPNLISDLKNYFKGTQGATLEVIVTWKERVLSTQHFWGKKSITLGSLSHSQVQVPQNYVPTQIGFIELGAKTLVFVPSYMKAELKRNSQIISQSDMMGKMAQTHPQGITVQIQQGDLLILTLGENDLQIFVRFVVQPPVATLLGNDLTAGELSGLIISLVLVTLFGIYIAMTAPRPVAEEEQQDPTRKAQFVYKQKEVREKMDMSAEQRQQPTVTAKSEAPPKAAKEQSEAKDQKAAKAAEVRAKPKIDRPKKFTSVKSGGATKISEQNSANAQSKDVTKSGILGALGGGGMRNQLDQAYSGTGQLLGVADQAKGTSGQSDNRAGEDLGSKIKDSGAGGKGVSMTGIQGVGTKGRSSGQNEYGDVGVGGKGSVAINIEGEGAGFTGGLDKEGIRRVIKSILGQLRACYETSLRSQENLEGSFAIEFDINDQGKVLRSIAKSSTINSKQVENCVANRIRAQKFPASPKGVLGEVSYPFTFRPQN